MLKFLQVNPFIFIHKTCKHYLRSNNHNNQQQLSKIKDFTNVVFNKQALFRSNICISYYSDYRH